MASVPRIVLVTRSTEYEQLLYRHGTRAQAAFFLESRDQSIEVIEAAHERVQQAVQAVESAIPTKWRRSRIERKDIDRFLFEPQDVVVAVGQDGLVANLAKYLSGQPVVGVNPDPALYDGVLVPHAPAAASELISAAGEGQVRVERRTMAEARLDDGQHLLALNEIFVGHCTHQSARYRLDWQGQQERQSSSGLIVSTGTGATGWARSIHLERHSALSLPTHTEQRLVFFVREAFPSNATGTSLTEGQVGEGNELTVISEFNEGGVIFADGIEQDALEFHWGMRLRVGLAKRQLALVQGPGS
jgi:NAD kinase